MPTGLLYGEIHQLLQAHVGEGLSEASLERLVLLVCGIIGARSASPARIAKALHSLGLSEAKAESIERRVRRIENDDQITSAICLHPLARERLLVGRPEELLLVLDPTCQDDRVVMVSAAVWYRGRALPLAWAIWPANRPLEGEGFWQRIEALLDEVAPLIPVDATVTWLADCAFGTPAFTDLVMARGWHYLVRVVQDQTRCRDRMGRESQVRALVRYRGQRKKLAAEVFKGRHWRSGSVLVYWGRRHKRPLCLVSDWAPAWRLMAIYRRRYSIEAKFRDYKSAGWRWEQGQVSVFAHLERLLVGMALATWMALAAGTQVAQELLCVVATGRRRTRPYEGKQSLFTLGLERLAAMLHDVCSTPLTWDYALGERRNWSQQITDHHLQAFLRS
ncbi:MAG: transposase [Anaerolineae bacterium]